MRALRTCAALIVAGCTAARAPAPAAPPAGPAAAASPSQSAAPAEGRSEGPGRAPLGHRFPDAERWAKVFDDPSRDAWQKPTDVVRLMRIEPGMTVADVGAGTGYFEPYLSRAVGARGIVLAVDIEPDMVRYLRDRAAREGLSNVRPILARTDDPLLPDTGVDRILIVDTWHHIPDREIYARKLARALKPGGFVAIVDYTLASDRGPPNQHRIPPDQAIAELRGGGLAAETIEEPLPDQYIVVGRKSP